MNIKKKLENWKRKIVYYDPFLFIILLLIFGGLFFLRPTITGYVIGSKEISYSDSLNLVINESSSYNWFLEHPGDLKSVRLDGSMSKRGSATIYLEHNNESYLIFDSSKLKEEGISKITGLVISDLTGNDSLDNESEKIIDESKPIENKSIIIKAEGGGRKTLEDIFEFNIISEFNWNVSYHKLCTKWNVNDISLCYGSSDCCALIGLESLGEWDSNLYLSYGRYGSGLENIVRAQVIYANYSLDIENPYSNIVYSDVEELTADFYHEVISFEDICIDTCLLPGFNETFYTLRFNISNATIVIDSVDYSIVAEINETNITATNITREETTKQHKAVIGKPVKWVKKVKLGEARENVSINITENAVNLSVNKIVNEKKIAVDKDKVKIKEKGFLKEAGNLITGYAIVDEVEEETLTLVIEEEVEEVEIEYYTEAPQAIETEISSTKKEIVISSEVHYEDILAFTDLPTEASSDAVHLYWLVNDSRQEVSIDKYDTNDNGLVDYIEWIVPSLSNQTYELIIEITKASHLDENRSFISDIYDEVKEQDSVWSEPIYSNDYVRVTFEVPLDNTRDITVYARSNTSASIEVYLKDSDEKIAEILNITEEGYYKTYLTGLEECYDDETEILTDEGWKLFKDLDKKEKVLTLNQETKKREWQKPTAYQEFEHKGEMYSIETSKGSLLVSPEHSVYARSNGSSFGLMLIVDVYELVKEGKEVMFMDLEGGEIKVLEVSKEEYNGRIYDVDVPNDVVLVRRKNYNLGGDKK